MIPRNKITIALCIISLLIVSNTALAQKGITLAELNAQNDSLNKLIPKKVKNEFGKTFPKATDVKWSNLYSIYMVEFNEGTSKASKDGYVKNRSHQVEYKKGGEKDGEWSRTIVDLKLDDVPKEVLQKMNKVLKENDESVNFISSVHCAEKCIGRGVQQLDVTPIVNSGYYVQGSKTWHNTTYIFNDKGDYFGK